MKTVYSITIVWAVILQLSLVGCIREYPQQTCEEKETVEIKITNLLPDSLDSFNNLKMHSVNLVFYPASGGTPINGMIADSSGKASVIHGKYSLLIYSSDFFDLDGVFYSGMEHPETAEAYTRSYLRSNTSKLIQEPDPLFCFYAEDFDPDKQQEEGKADDQPARLSVVLSPLVYTYRFKIRVEGIQHLQSATATVTGMYTSVYLKDGHHREDEEGTMQIKMTKNAETSNEGFIYGEFRSFGSHQRSDVSHHISIVLNNDETKVVELDDLTASIKKIPHGGEIVIKQKIVINDNGGDQEGTFDPEVADWDNVVIPLPI